MLIVIQRMNPGDGAHKKRSANAGGEWRPNLLPQGAMMKPRRKATRLAAAVRAIISREFAQLSTIVHRDSETPSNDELNVVVSYS